MSEIQLKNIKYRGDLPDTTYDNPGYKDGENGDLPPYSEKADEPVSPTSLVIDTPSSNEFSPNSPRADHEDSEDSEADFEDLDPIDSPALVRIKNAQDALWNYTDDHGTMLRAIFTIVLLLLYFAYFIYAMIYHFGDEGSIRLLWVTIVVVIGIIIHLIKRFAGDKIWACIEPCYEKIEPHGLKINWTILCLLYVFIVIFVLVDVFYVTKNYYNIVSLSGIVLYVLLFFIFSYSPAHVSWRAVLWGLALQFIFAMVILKTYWGFTAFQWLGMRVDEFLAHADAGSIFLFGDAYTNHFFAFKILPVIIFFSAAISVLFYLGWMQEIIKKVAWVMQVCMGTTAAESLNAAGNIFIGQSEAPLLIRPLIQDMTRSELHAVMTGGFATIAGTVLAAYIGFGVPANHLLSASVMSAPAALAMAKLFYPETKKSRTTKDDMDKIEQVADRNVIEAISSGASNAISLVANIAANLIAFLAVLHFINASLTWFGARVDKIGIYPPEHEDITLEWFMSYLLWPLAIIMGTEINDCRQVAQLIGIKTILNEFVAYKWLGEIKDNTADYQNALAQGYDVYFQDIKMCITNGTQLVGGTQDVNGTWLVPGTPLINVTEIDRAVAVGMDACFHQGIMTERSIVISTYALCGFANFGSMGIMLGALGAMAPNRKRDLSRIVLRAMIAGNVACFMTAAIAGLFYQGEF